MAKHPSLFQGESAWKMTKITPLVDAWAGELSDECREVRLLDVGGGAGLLLKGVAAHIEEVHHRCVRKYAIDLSPGMLEVQRRNNPDLIAARQEDITETSWPDKAIDLALMIDVLEHVPQPVQALRELGRIAHWVIFKVPLENHLVHNLSNLLNLGRTRQAHREDLGHVNFYTAGALKRQIETHLGRIHHFSYANGFEYTLNCQPNTDNAHLRLIIRLCAALHRVSGRLASWLFTDFAMVLAQP